VYDVPASGVSEEFAECWQAAGIHLQEQAQRVGVTLSWLKADHEPPFLEHLSFRIGNQLFFIRLEGIDGPGNLDGLMSIADGCKEHPCVLPMEKSSTGWAAMFPGWGLVHAGTRGFVHPSDLVTSEPIEMTDWEVHDFAVQTVRQQLEEEGRRIMSAQGNPRVDPSVWFVGDHGPEWVVVRAVRYPLSDAKPPTNWAQIAAGCARLSTIGHFASVAVASAHNSFDDAGQSVAPLLRDGPMYVDYPGLRRMS